MSLARKFAWLTSISLSAGLAMGVSMAQAKEFTFSAKANDRMAKKLNIPIYFALPASARGPVPGNVDTTDLLIDFKHPEAKANSNLGLRLIVTKRSGMAARLAKSGLVQTGDLLLTFRSEWGGAGAYPNVQMGISHTGVAYVKDGFVHNIDNPLNEEYLGARMRADLTSEHYRTLDFIHVIRPRYLTEEQRANVLAWATRINSSASSIYPSQISFNQDYNAPKFKPGKPLEFVKHVGQIALGQKPGGTVDMFCSEFAWSLLSLRNCNPAKAGEEFNGSSMPVCIREPMKPMAATGDYIFSRGRNSYTGLADGPLLVVDSLKLPADERKKVLELIFVDNPANMSKLSIGHRTLAASMQPKFAPLSQYYLGATGNMFQSLKARLLTKAFTREIPENYSPTSFLVNTLLPTDNVNRTMDYIATIVIE